MIVTPRKRKPFETKYARKFRLALREQLARVLAINDYNGIESRLLTLVTPDPIRRVFVELYREVGTHFAKLAENQFKDGDIWEMEMERYALEIAGEHITWITETSRELILDSVRKGVKVAQEQGLGISQATDIIQRELLQRYGKIERWRAMRIANTEILTASNRGAQVATEKLAERYGVPMKKTWLIGGRNVRDTHQAANGQSVGLKADFVVGGHLAKMPGDPRLPAEETINCKCTVIYEPLV